MSASTEEERMMWALFRRPVMISPVILLDTQLSLAARAVACCAFTLFDRRGSIDDLASVCGLTEAEINAHMDELTEAGYISNNSITDDPEALYYHRILEARRAEQNRHQSTKAATPDSHVYLIRSGNFHKIGISQKPPSRFKQIQKTVPYPLDVIGVWPMPKDRASTTEAELHATYAHKRRAGEWFELSRADVSQIQGRLSAEP